MTKRAVTLALACSLCVGGATSIITTATAGAKTHPKSKQMPEIKGPGVVMTITGSGTALTVTILDQGRESQHKNVPLPYTTTLTDHPSLAGIGAQSSNGAKKTTVSCSIKAAGQTMTTHRSRGPFAMVDCSAAVL